MRLAGAVLKAEPSTLTETSHENLPVAGLTHTAFLVKVPFETVAEVEAKSRSPRPVLAA